MNGEAPVQASAEPDALSIGFAWVVMLPRSMRVPARHSALSGDAFQVVYFLFDGELGHNDAMQMVSQVGLHLISKHRGRCAGISAGAPLLIM